MKTRDVDAGDAKLEVQDAKTVKAEGGWASVPDPAAATVDVKPEVAADHAGELQSHPLLLRSACL